MSGGVDCCIGLGDEAVDAGGSGVRALRQDDAAAAFLAEMERVVPWSVRQCQLKRPWYARRVGGAAVRVGELLCSPIMLPAQASGAGKRRPGSAKLTMPSRRLAESDDRLTAATFFLKRVGQSQGVYPAFEAG
jgi:hypothetical protein